VGRSSGPRPVDPTASDAERITRLESYVERIDQDLEAVHRLIDRKDSEPRQAMVEADDRVRSENSATPDGRSS
jgi:hypothetical protein